MSNILEYIESHYPVDQVLVNGRQGWPYLRYQYYVNHSAKELQLAGEESRALQPSQGHNAVSILRFLKNILRDAPYGFSNWFRRYDYVILTGSDARRLVADKYVNPFLDPLVDELAPARALFIENTSPSAPCRMKQVYTRYVVSRGGLFMYALFIMAVRRILCRRHKIVNKVILDRIEADLGLTIDATVFVEFAESTRKAFTHLFRMMRPRAVLLTCYYGREPAVNAAKDLGIKVVEVQHGSIGKEHPAYNVHLDIDKSCFPDHLLVYGDRELAMFADSRFIEKARVHPVGSFYIDYVRASYAPDPRLAADVSRYEKTVGVTLQWTCEKRLVGFISDAAALDAGILYMLIPREPQNPAYSDMVLPPNVVVIRDKNFYELMAYCDFHSTVYSTCALEAPSLGVQNILVDLDGLARSYYREVLSDARVTRFANTPDEYVTMVNSFRRLDRDVVCELHKGFFAPGYRENIRKFVKEHLL